MGAIIIYIYSTPTCVYCVQAKRYLDKLGAEWEERSALTHADYPALANLYGMTVPLIYNGKDGFCGFDARKIKELVESL